MISVDKKYTFFIDVIAHVRSNGVDTLENATRLLASFYSKRRWTSMNLNQLGLVFLVGRSVTSPRAVLQPFHLVSS